MTPARATRGSRGSPGHRTGARWAVALALFGIAAASPGVAKASPPDAIDYDAPDPNRNGLSWLRAAANVTFTNYAIFQIDWFRQVNWISITRRSIVTNATSWFQFDYDPVSEDLLGHPLGGSLYFTSARAAGLSFWESALFPFFGSLEWEVAGERQLEYPGNWRSKPSTNDFIATSTSGAMLGEILYRVSSAVLDDSATGSDRLARELLAAGISPMRGLNRLYTGEMWKAGPPPEDVHPLHLSFDAGLDRLDNWRVQHDTYHPSALLALAIDYGDLLPLEGRRTLEPFDFFEGYGAFTLLAGHLNGTQVYGQGLLYGWSSRISDESGARRDNDVFGLAQTFDYQGTNVTRFGALSVGPVNYVTWRFGTQRSLRLGMDFDWTYLAAIDSPFAVDTVDTYTMGAAVGESVRADLGAFGRLDFRGRQYVTASLDGRAGEEIIGYGRAAYEVDVLPNVGIGLAPTLINHRSSWRGRTVTDTSLDAQLYLRIHE